MIDGMRIIDFHGHSGRQEGIGMIDNPEVMLRTMDAVGIDIACLFHIFCPDGTTSNDINAQFIAAHPDRFVGFAYVSPLMPERMVPELERAIDELGFIAIKLYPPFTPWPFNEERWYPIYEFANDRSPPLAHRTCATLASR